MLVCRLLLSAMPPPLFSPNPLSSMRRQATRMKRHIRALLFVLPFRTAAFSTRPPPTRPFGATTTTTTTSAASPSPTPRHRPRITHQGPRRPGRWRRSVATGYGGGGGGMDDEGRTTVGGGMKILGICGGIGSGKSTACRLMVDSLGCAARIGERRWDMMVTSMMTHALRLYFIVAQFFFFFSLVRRYQIRPQDADKLAHAVYEPGSRASEEIASEFGGGVVLDCPGGGDVQIDRKKLGAIVFGDPASMSVRNNGKTRNASPHAHFNLARIPEDSIPHIEKKNCPLASCARRATAETGADSMATSTGENRRTHRRDRARASSSSRGRGGRWSRRRG